MCVGVLAHESLQLRVRAIASGLNVTHRSLSWPGVTDRCLISAPANHSPTPPPRRLPLTRH